MAVISALVRTGTRRHLVGLATVALVLAAGLGVGLASIDVAARTADAYPAYLRRAHVGELVVNPSLATDQTEALIRSIPGVVSLTSDRLLSASADDGHPRPQSEADSGFLQVRMSYDGRYQTQDRPVVRDGRMIGTGSEAFLSVEAADELGVGVGDTIPLAFWGTTYYGPDAEPDDAIVAPLGKAKVRVVGVGVFPDEVLADELYPRSRILITPDVGSRFDCTVHHPDPDDPRTIEELAAELLPSTCAFSYRYFSLRVDGGDAGAVAVADSLSQRFREENDRLPQAMRAANVGYEVIPSFRADDAKRVRQSLGPAVTALRAFGITAGLSSIAVALLLVLRLLRRREDEVLVWRSLGISRGGRTLGLAVAPGCAGALGFAGAVAVAWLGSGAGPVASARAIAPHAGRGLSVAVAIPLACAVALFGLGLLLGAHRVASRPQVTSGRRIVLRRSFWDVRGSPSFALGLRAATRGRSAGVLLAEAITAVTAVTATLVFSTSLLRLVDTPDRFGWPYDVAAVVNAGYGPADLAAIAATLDRPEVDAWGVAALAGGLVVNGETLPFVAGRAGFDDLMTGATISGRAPRGDREIALGSLTARTLGLHVGDEATVRTPHGEQTATISGLVVLPAIGPLESDRMSLGTGVFLPQAFFEAVLGNAEETTGIAPAALADGLASFVAIDLADGADAGAFLAEIRDDLPTWSPDGVEPLTYAKPIRPAAIIDVADMRQVPMSLVGIFVLTMAVSIVAGIATGTRARRRELAVVRASGGTPRQLRASVRWHGLVVVSIGLAVGFPAGIVLGRLGFDAFARGFGAAPQPSVPLLLLCGTVIVVLATGLLAGAVPALQVARRQDIALLQADGGIQNASG